MPARAEIHDARELLRAAPGLLLVEEGEPLGVIDAVGQEAIVVSVEESAQSRRRSGACSTTHALAALGALWIAGNALRPVRPALA